MGKNYASIKGYKKKYNVEVENESYEDNWKKKVTFLNLFKSKQKKKSFKKDFFENVFYEALFLIFELL